MNQTPKYEHIPRATIQRLATYLQVLEAMDKDGVQVISSEPLSRACDVNASQVRKDLAYFGEFGVRGVGYYVSYLLEVIKACLNANREWRAALVGVGNMGRALLNYQEFRRHGFTIVGAFDCDPFKIGEKLYGLEVYCTKTLMEKVPELGIEIGIITVPAEYAQGVCDLLIENGILAIWNFAPKHLNVPDGILVQNENMAASLALLCKHLNERMQGQEG